MTESIDIVVYGATGFTGRLIVEYLRQRAQSEGLTLAISGRSTNKLEAIRVEPGSDQAIPIIVADSTDPDSLDRLAARARVVIAAAGPYTHHGSGVVEACARAGTDYVDLAGESAWLREMIDRHHATAAKTGARLVHSCGFDSIPSDLGVYLLQSACIDLTGSAARRVKGRVQDFNGTASGGTIASIIDGLNRASDDPKAAALLTDPFALTPGITGPDQPDARTPRHDDELGTWATAFAMATINSQVVHRTNQLLEHRHGPDLRYDEMLVTGPGDTGRALADELRASGGIPMDGELPRPGEGPSRAEREGGSFRFTFNAPDLAGAPILSVSGDLDPGYGSTSKMITEAAITLLQDVPNLPGGSWTPAAALGDALHRRLVDQSVLDIGFG